MHFMLGKAQRDAKRGWFIGQFVPAEFGIRRRTDVEVKWGIHTKGERRGDVWASYRTSSTISVLIDGSFIVRLRVDGQIHEVLLEEKGDYIIISPQIDHNWESPEDSTILTIRCPSVSGDLIERIDR